MADADDLTTTSSPESSSSPASNSRQIADFECNICFDLAQDPVITLCGHLHCWPCLYKWLQLHSHSHECPVCKTRIEDETLIIPLYGRGNTTTTDHPRLNIPIPGVEIPRRPAGQRPETAPPPPPPPPEANNLTDAVFRRFIPVAPAALSGFGVSAAGFGGVLSPIFGLRYHGFSDGSGYGGSSGYNYGYSAGSFGEGGLNRESSEGNDVNLKKILVFILLFVLFDFLTI